MSMFDLDKAYVSPYDKFMRQFDTTHAKTPSQLKEIEKHQRIAHLRDNPSSEGEAVVLWEAF